MNKNYYTRSEVEHILGVSASTVKRLLSVGILDGWQESGQSGTGKVWCVSIESVQKYARENNIELTDLSSVESRQKSDSVDRNVSDSRQSTVDQTVAQPVDSRPKKNKDTENKEVKPVDDSRSQINSVDRTVSDSRPDTSARSTVDRELQAEMAILKKELELTKKQLDTATEDYRKDKDFLHQQIEAKDTMINQQNQIIMATQKNMNDILCHHNELQFSHAKKEDLIKQLEFDRSKTESSVRAIAKLERMIDDAIMTKRLKDGIEFSKELMKEKKNK
jgi:hypothetical protein